MRALSVASFPQLVAYLENKTRTSLTATYRQICTLVFCSKLNESYEIIYQLFNQMYSLVRIGYTDNVLDELITHWIN